MKWILQWLTYTYNHTLLLYTKNHALVMNSQEGNRANGLKHILQFYYFDDFDSPVKLDALQINAVTKRTLASFTCKQRTRSSTHVSFSFCKEPLKMELFMLCVCALFCSYRQQICRWIQRHTYALDSPLYSIVAVVKTTCRNNVTTQIISWDERSAINNEIAVETSRKFQQLMFVHSSKRIVICNL